MRYKTKIIKIPLCEVCGKELPEQNPRFKSKDGFYCGDCALRAGKITKEEYIKNFLYFVAFGSVKDVIVEDDKIRII